MSSDPKKAELRTVLVADDDDATRRALGSVLRHQGYEVIEFGDGEAALEALAAAADTARPPPDVMLLDFCMPGLSGIGVLRVLRRFGRLPPTILMTGFPDSSVETFAQGAGALKVLRKPVDVDAVIAAIEEALAHA